MSKVISLPVKLMAFSPKEILEALLLVVALSADTFAASFAYGTNKIKIMMSSTLIINGICTLALTLSLVLGNLLRPILSNEITRTVSFTVLFVLGMSKLFDSTIKAYIRKYNKFEHELHFSFLYLRFILNVYADPKIADVNESNSLSPMEALSLAIALSFDGFAVGLGAALVEINVWYIIILSFIIGILAIVVGSFIGNLISKKISMNISWLSGILLLVIAFLKIR